MLTNGNLTTLCFTYRKNIIMACFSKVAQDIIVLLTANLQWTNLV